ncbi:hypothetical protein KKA39_01360 [Patescibacteria group bacterium]|nr:hypothetical protein [Patescibacteria group bacterium]MBU1727940.1 hypothetical protein [Patescibacteria group bacterium]
MLLPQISEAQLNVENDYKGYDLNSSFSIRVDGYRDALESLQKNNEFLFVDDSILFEADSAFGDGKYSVSIFCRTTRECLTFKWGCKMKRYSSFNISPCNELFVAYSKNFHYPENCGYYYSDTTTIVFCMREDETGGYFKMDPNGSLFIGRPYLNETTFSPANKNEIEILKRKVIDICMALRKADGLYSKK